MAFEFDLNKVKESLVNAGKEVESMARRKKEEDFWKAGGAQ